MFNVFAFQTVALIRIADEHGQLFGVVAARPDRHALVDRAIANAGYVQ
ncbi:hypothetical protein [Tahibacter sp.]|nr:hypothetical protein [Tahibacter sp.]